MDAANSAVTRPDANPVTVFQVITGLGVGGAERVVLELSKKLNQHAWRVVIVSLDGNSRLLEQYQDLTSPIYTLEIERNPWSVLKALPRLITILKRERPSIIHAHMFHGLLAAFLCRAIRPTTKIVFTSHSFAGFSRLRSSLIRATRWFRSADIIFVEGQHPSLNAIHTRVIPNGVATTGHQSRPAPDRQTPYIFLFAGRLQVPKNPIALVTAFGSMRHRDCQLWLAGDGPLRPQIEQRIGELDLVERVKLLGIRTDVTELMHQADCFVMASHWEGLPMVLLEAGAVGMPVIAPPVGAIPQLLGDGCGYVTEVAQLAQTMDAVMDAPEEARVCGVKLRERILAGYSVDVMADMHSRLYQEIVKRT